MIYIRSTLFMVLVILITAPYGLAISLLGFLPLSWRYAIIASWRHIFMFLVHRVLGIRMVVKGRENIPAQAAVVLSKHQSAWETVALQELFSPAVFVMKKELYRLPFFGWGLAAMRMIGIDRSAGKDALFQVVEQGRDRLARGLWVIVFPEGTRVAPGLKKRFKIGGAHLAVNAGVPVVPVAHNAGELWKRNAFLKQPGTVTLSIGPAIDTTGLSDQEANQRAEAWIEAEMRVLSPHRYK